MLLNIERAFVQTLKSSTTAPVPFFSRRLDDLVLSKNIARCRIGHGAGPNVTLLGTLPRDAVLDEMRRAAMIVVPSIWYEGFPMVIVEAFACATPVIGSQIGALAELVENGITGLHVPPADPAALADRIGQILRDPAEGRKLGRAARRTFMERYTPDVNRKLLEAIYRKAIERASSTRIQSG